MKAPPGAGGFTLALAVCGVAALAAAAVTAVGMFRVPAAEPTTEALVDPLHPDLDEPPPSSSPEPGRLPAGPLCRR